jgi:hypothetical protein
LIFLGHLAGVPGKKDFNRKIVTGGQSLVQRQIVLDRVRDDYRKSFLDWATITKLFPDMEPIGGAKQDKEQHWPSACSYIR